jgi:hypothetical protein
MKNDDRIPPAFMLAAGIEPCESFQVSRNKMREFQREQYPLKTRVWATLLLHCGGSDVSDVPVVPLTTTDIARELRRELRRYGRESVVCGVSAESVRRAVVRLEIEGFCERRIGSRRLRDLSQEELKRVHGGVAIWVLHTVPSYRPPNIVGPIGTIESPHQTVQ